MGLNRQLSIVLLGVLAFGAHGIARAEVQIGNDTLTGLKLQRTSPSATLKVSTSLQQSLGQPQTTVVRYYQGDRIVFTATLSVSGDSDYTVSGVVSGTSFGHQIQSFGDSFATSYSLGGSSIELEVGSNGPDQSSAEALASFADGAPANVQAVVDDMVSFLAEAASLPIDNAYLFNQAVAALKATGVAPSAASPLALIGDYTACVQDACTEAGACWNPQNVIACQACPGMSRWERLVSFALYELGAIACGRAAYCTLLCAG